MLIWNRAKHKQENAYSLIIILMKITLRYDKRLMEYLNLWEWELIFHLKHRWIEWFFCGRKKNYKKNIRKLKTNIEILREEKTTGKMTGKI